MASLNIEWLFLQIYNLFTKGVHIAAPGSGFKNTIVFILSFVSVIFLAIIVYSVIRLKERQRENHHEYHSKIHHMNGHKEQSVENQKWLTVLEHINSGNPADWRLAIIEADNMLDNLTVELGLVGENLGERLKNASPNHFKSLDSAWEAHKIRNRVAHDGLAYHLSYREAKKTIENYENVFSEFEIV